MIRYTVSTCTQKLTASQLNLPQGTKQKKTKTKKTRAKDVLQNTDRTEAIISVHSRHTQAATQWCHLLLDDVTCSVWRTPYNALSIGMMQQFSRFCPW